MSRIAYDPTQRSPYIRHRITSTTSEPTRGPIGTPLVLVVLFLMMVVVDMTRGSSGAGAVPALPESVIGTWVTADARYADRSIQIDPELVVIRRGEGDQAAVGVVRDSRQWREGDHDVVRVEYRTDEGDFSIELLPEKRGLRLRHPAQVLWTRRGS